MKNIINAILLLLLTTSCLTVGRIQKNCDKFAKVCVTGTTKEIVYRDTTIYITDTLLVPLPKDTVEITDTITIINNQAFLPQQHYQKGIIGVDLGVKWSVLNINAYLTDSTILYPVLDTIFLKEVITEEVTTKYITLPPERFVPKFYKFTFWAFWVFIAIILIWIAIKLKPYLKFLP